MLQEINNPNDFDSIRLRVASPEIIKNWSHGEVTKPETINYRTQKPEKDGLFCEKIFGPTKDWECYCGKYKRIRYKGIICDKCGVEVTRALVRRERFGHIELATPVSHIWFLRGVPSKIGLVLDMSPLELEKVIYFANFIVVKVDEDLRQQTLKQVEDELKAKRKQIEGDAQNRINQINGNNNITAEARVLKVEEFVKQRDLELNELSEAAEIARRELKDLRLKQIISESAYQDLSLKYGHVFEAAIGAEAVQQLLRQVDVKQEMLALQTEEKETTGQRKKKAIKRLKILKSLHERGIDPSWMIMTNVPVVPPDLRPMVALEGGRFAASDLNDLYRRVINRNNRLKKLSNLNAPEVIVRNEKRMLQEAVDALIDNSARHGKTVTSSTGQKRMLKSLADSLKGKQGRFRQNLLGKRVDYSGRSVIVVGPKLKLHQCGLPKMMALELFRPFVIAELIKREYVHNVRSANRFIESSVTEIFDILEEIIKGTHVMLNRAPTLHRLGIQAFQPVLIEGKAIQLHPLVCSAFNADFDGDQMAVHVLLTEQAKREAAEIMLSSKNLLKPATGEPVVTPQQDMVLGLYYMTYIKDKTEIDDKKLKHFSEPSEALLAYNYETIGLQDLIMVRFPEFYCKKCGVKPAALVKTTVGRLYFNEVLPDKLKFFNNTIDRSVLKKIVASCFEICGEETTAELVDKIKELSLSFVTISGISWGMSDLPELKEKDAILDQVADKVTEVRAQYEQGLLTNDERYTKVVELWEQAKDQVAIVSKRIMNLMPNNPVNIIMNSGARGSWGQTIQMIGMKGSVTNPAGKIIELPVTGSFKHGIDVLEYFISTHGARKGMADTALKTAKAGYLTRRLVDVSQDVVIVTEDCGDKVGFEMTKEDSEAMNTALAKRLLGRVAGADIKDPQSGAIVVKKGEYIDHEIARKLEKIDLDKARIRSVLTCQANHGLCTKCYGWDLGHNQPVKIGTAVGVIAAQSIGEPGTQLTMRTFHTGGVASEADITQGLPRVEEIFEVRPLVKHKAIISPIAGEVKIQVNEETKEKVLIISGKEEHVESINISNAEIDELLVKDGQKVKKGDLIIENKKRQETAGAAGKVEMEETSTGDWVLKIKAARNVDKEIVLSKDQTTLAQDGCVVERGERLTEGSIDLGELYDLRGKAATQRYIINEIQFVYSSQGQPINDRHVEIITRQMFSRVYVEDAGDTILSLGEVVELSEFLERNAEAREKGQREAKGKQMLLGITKSSLSTSSFFSAASFQETAKVLIEAAVSGKVDHLRGLKENVIIGRLIPVGTGYRGSREA